MKKLAMVLCVCIPLVHCDKSPTTTNQVEQEDTWISGKWHGILQFHNSKTTEIIDIDIHDQSGEFQFSAASGGTANGLWYDDSEKGEVLFDIQNSDTNLIGRPGEQKTFQYILSGQSLKFTSEYITMDLRKSIETPSQPEEDSPLQFAEKEELHCLDYDAHLFWQINIEGTEVELNISRLTSEVVGYSTITTGEFKSQSLIEIVLEDHRPPLKLQISPDTLQVFESSNSTPRTIPCIEKTN